MNKTYRLSKILRGETGEMHSRICQQLVYINRRKMFINPRLLAKFGYAPEDFLNFEDLTSKVADPKRRKRLLKRFELAFQQGHVVPDLNCEVEIRCKGGSLKKIYVTSRYIIEGGETILLVPLIEQR